MRKIKCLVILLVLFSSSANIANIKAEQNQYDITTEYENGLRIETIIIEDVSVARTSEKSGTKTVNYYNGNTLLCSVSVHGKFKYGGNSATCTSATVSAYSNNSNWKISNKSARKSGNTAYASATGTRYFMGVEMQKVTRNVSLSCNSSGKLS